MSYKQDCRLEAIKRLYGSYPVRTEIIVNDCIDLNFSLNCLNFLWLTTSSSSYESSILFTNLVIDQKQNFLGPDWKNPADSIRNVFPSHR